MTASVILVLLFSGHALFAVPNVPAETAGHSTPSQAVIPEHLQLRERSARGLAETGIQNLSACTRVLQTLCCRLDCQVSHLPRNKSFGLLVHRPFTGGQLSCKGRRYSISAGRSWLRGFVHRWQLRNCRWSQGMLCCSTPHSSSLNLIMN